MSDGLKTYTSAPAGTSSSAVLDLVSKLAEDRREIGEDQRRGSVVALEKVTNEATAHSAPTGKLADAVAPGEIFGHIQLSRIPQNDAHRGVLSAVQV